MAVKINENAKLIWTMLMDNIGNPYGVAAIMGNLFAESSMNPICCTKLPKNVESEQEYVNLVNSGQISEEEFIHDGVAFGLAQWRYWSRKKLFYEYVMSVSPYHNIGLIKNHAAYLVIEMSNFYKTAWNAVVTATDIREASDIVMTKYEKPGTVTEAAKAKRAAYGEEYFKALYEKPNSQLVDPVVPANPDIPDKNEEDEEMLPDHIYTTANKVILRSGNGSEYGSVMRIEKSGTMLEVVAKSRNNWYAVKVPGNEKRVLWVTGKFVKE